MARVPVYDREQVAPAPLPTAREGSRASADMFGVDRGRSMEQAGRQVQAMGERLGDVAIDARIRQTEAEAKDADNRLAARVREILRDPENGFLNRMGQNAVDGREAATQALERAISEIAGGMQGNRSREIFMSQAAIRRESALGQVDGHASVELRRFEAEASQARIENAASDAVLAYNDPATFSRFMTTGLAELRDQAEREGWSDDQLRNAATEWSSGVHRQTVARLLSDGDLRSAAAHYEANAGAITGEDATRIEDALRSERERQARAAAAAAASAERSFVDDLERAADFLAAGGDPAGLPFAVDEATIRGGISDPDRADRAVALLEVAQAEGTFRRDLVGMTPDERRSYVEEFARETGDLAGFERYGGLVGRLSDIERQFGETVQSAPAAVALQSPEVQAAATALDEARASGDPARIEVAEAEYLRSSVARQRLLGTSPDNINPIPPGVSSAAAMPTIEALSRETGRVPAGVVSRIEGLARLGGEDGLAQAANLYRTVREQAPFARMEIDPGVRSMVEGTVEGIDQGLPAATAAEGARTLALAVTPEVQDRRREQWRDLGGADLVADALVRPSGGGVTGWFTTDARIPDQMAAEVERMAARNYLLWGNEDRAVTQALEDVQSTWAVTEIGPRRWQRQSPEAVYGAVAGSTEWIGDQLLSTLADRAPADLGLDFTDRGTLDRLVLEPMPGSGSQPEYLIMVEGEMGTLHPISGVRFRPDRSLEFDRLRGENEATRSQVERAQDYRDEVFIPRIDATEPVSREDMLGRPD